VAVVLELDHLVIAAETLAEGVAHVEDRLGVRMVPGGKHPAMGTHNALLLLGEVYLEVIAIDPGAPAPGRARWFGLDSFSGSPRVTNWVARTGDLGQALALAPQGAGTPMALSRGDLRWSMAVPGNGILPFGSGFPALIQWHGDAHPALRLPDVGCGLAGLEVRCDDLSGLRDALAHFDGNLDGFLDDSSGARFEVSVATPTGTVILQ
jgi:hypothetical protein